MRSTKLAVDGGTSIKSAIRFREHRHATERRARPRLLLNHDFKARIFFSQKEKKPATVAIEDLSGGGISFLVRGERPDSSDAEKVSVLFEDKKLATKRIKEIRSIPLEGEEGAVRISLLFEEENVNYYIPRECVEKAGSHLYTLRSDKNPVPLLKSLLGSGTAFQDRRSHQRLRLPFSENVTVSLKFAATGEEFRFSDVADVSPAGLSFFIDHLGFLDPVRGLPQWTSISFDGNFLIEKKIRKISLNPMIIDDIVRFKVGVLFDREASFRLPPEISVSCEDGQLRLREKGLLPRLLLAMTASSADVQISTVPADALKDQVYGLRFRTYLQEGKINPADYPSEEMTDPYDHRSIHLAARINATVIASVRITMDGMGHPLDVEQICGDKIDRADGLKYAEVSRLCIDPLFRRNANQSLDLLITLFIETYRICLKNEIDRLLITSYDRHLSLYRMFGFRVISAPFRIPGFHYDYVAMEFDMKGFERMAESIRPFFVQVFNQVASTSTLSREV